MYRRMWTVGLVLALGLLPAGASAAPVADKASPDQINKLIQQLGSSDFAEREKATTELEKMGSAALEPLQKAAQGDDAEVARRAKALVGKVERRATAERVLQPRKVHLVYKDTPLSEAVADFQKKTGYTLQLIDPDNKLKDRKITLDTGETGFWHALSLFCDKAGLVEGTMQDFWQARQGRPVIQPFPLPGNPGNPPPGIRKGRPPVPPQPAPPAEEINKDKVKTKEAPNPATPAPPPPPVAAPPQAAPAQPPQPAQPVQAAQIQVQVQVQGGPAQAMPVQVGVGGGGWAMGGFAGPGQNTTPIILKDGKPKGQACDDRSAIRVRVFDPAQMVGPPAGKDVITLGVEVRPEPRLQMTSLKQVRIDKAVDDQGQTLSTAKDDEVAPGGGFPGAAPPGAVAPGFRIGRPMIPAGMGMMGGMTTFIRLKAGEKAAKSLKQLKGVASVTVISDDQACITVDNVLKASGKTFKGEHGASIKVVEVKDKDDAVTLRLEVQQPNQGQGGAMPVPIMVPPAPVQPAPAPAAPPPPRGAQAGQAGAGVAQPGRVLVRPAQIGGGAGAAGPAVPVQPMPGRGVGPMFREGFMGLTLRDEKGNSLPLNISMQAQWVGGGAPQVTYELTWKRQDSKAKPTKLVLASRTPVEVDVPFTLENVPLP